VTIFEEKENFNMAYAKWKDLEQVESYAQRRYRSWDQRLLNSREQKIVRKLFREYNISGTILDIPVGYGRFLPLLSEFGSVLASDIGFLPVLYQKEKTGIARGSVNASAQHLPFKEKSVDVVFCFRLLQHMHHRDERIAIFREFKRLSRQWVIVSLYLTNPLHRLHRTIIRQSSRITMLTRDELNFETREAELSLVQIIPVIPGFHAHRICLFSTKNTDRKNKLPKIKILNIE
jgi:ubiquinone/menaquinone biosynthesis C-methylase UbiE